MNRKITINEKELKPSATLAREFGYSIDYISKLAREGKVEATKVGRQWFVEMTSLKNFVDNISKKKEINRIRLRAQRKIELESYSIQKSDQKIHSQDYFRNRFGRVSVFDPSHSFVRYFDIATSAIGSFLVIIAGVLFSMVISPSEFHDWYASLDREWFLKTNPYDMKSSDVIAGAFGSWVEPKETSYVSSTHDNSQPSSGLVVFSEYKSKSELDRVRASFSDEVEVKFESDDVGVITPVFLNGRGDEYQFLMVPVTNDAS